MAEKNNSAMTIAPTVQQNVRTLEIRLFGVCEVRLGGKPLPPLRYRADLWLLAYLTLRGSDRDVSRDTLAATLWPDAEGAQGLYYLRRSLTNLRRALGGHAERLLSPTTRTLRLDLSGVFADVVAFDTLLSASAAGSAARPMPSAEDIAQAIDLYRGPLGEDCPDDWITTDRTAREQAYLAALETLADRLAARGALVDATRPLRLLIAADPYRESAYAALMTALAENGDSTGARKVYGDLQRALRVGLTASPSAETTALYQRLQKRAAPPPPIDSAPLSHVPRQETGRHLPIPLTDLIGREAAVTDVVGWLKRCRLVALLGPGGVGKTRLGIAVAEAALPQFPDGVWFVDLAPLQEFGDG